MAKVVEKEPRYSFMITYSALLYKTDKYADAEAWANKAIEKAREKRVPATDADELLAKIKKAEEENK